MTLATTTSASAPRALRLLTILLASVVLCVGVGSLLLRVCRVVTLRLAISAIAAIVTVVSSTAVTLTVIFAVLAIVTLLVTRSVSGPPTILLALTAAIPLMLF